MKKGRLPEGMVENGSQKDSDKKYRTVGLATPEDSGHEKRQAFGSNVENGSHKDSDKEYQTVELATPEDLGA